MLNINFLKNENLYNNFSLYLIIFNYIYKK